MAVEAGDAAAHRPEPESAVGPHRDGVHAGVRQAVLGGVRDPGPAVEAGDAAPGAEPESTVGPHRDGRYDVVRQAIVGGVGGPGLAVEAGDAAAHRTEPESAVGPRRDGVHAVGRQAVVYRILGVRTGFHVPSYNAARAYRPQVAVPVKGHIRHIIGVGVRGPAGMQRRFRRRRACGWWERRWRGSEQAGSG